MKEMVLLEDEIKIFNEELKVRLEDTNPTIEEMATGMETGNWSQYEKIKRDSTGEKQTNMETFYSKQADRNNSVKESLH
jgi:hypothetical protein